MIRGIAILSLTLLVVALIPFVGPIVVMMTPLPMIYCFSQLGRIRGWLALAAACILASGSLLLLGRPVAMVVLVMVALTGGMVWEVLQRHMSVGRTIAIASLALFFSAVGILLGHAWTTGAEPWGLIERYVEGVIRENLQLYGQMNISPEQLNLIGENTPQITRFITGIFPALCLSGAILTIWLNVLVGRLLFAGRPDAFPDFGEISVWKAPEKLVWLLILAGGLVMAPWDVAVTVGINILIVCCLIYFFQGLAIAAFFFKRKRVPVILRWLFYVLITVQQYLSILVVAFGLFDLWVDFRKRIAGSDVET